MATPLAPQRLTEVARLFLKFGCIAFGGPAAHIAMMRAEFVQRRQWLDDQHFLDLLGATNLIPGPNSTEMTMHLGSLRAGWRGLIVAGVCFIMPAMLIVMVLAWVYVHFGTLPTATWLLYGVKPVVIAIIVQALWGLLPRAMSNPLHAGVGLATLVLYFVGVNELLLLGLAGVMVMLVRNLQRLRPAGTASVVLPLLGLPLPAVALTSFSLPVLFFTFLKIGSVLYGSGYVLLAFLRADFVLRLGWLTDQQLLDAVAIGQVTPGPVFTTATFIGFVLAGVPGALWATVGIFLPAFLFVAISNPLIPRLRHSPWASGMLDGVNVASLGLMAAVTVQLGRASLLDPLTIMVALVAAGVLFYWKVNATWLIAGGAMVGLLRAA